jgi:hypothetical protein
VQLWDADKLKQVRSMNGHRARVSSLAWNNHVLSSGGRDSQAGFGFGLGLGRDSQAALQPDPPCDPTHPAARPTPQPAAHAVEAGQRVSAQANLTLT